MTRSRSTRRLGVAVVLAFAGAAAAGPPPPPRHHRVELRELTFQPAVLRIAPGDTVTWTNHDMVPHTVTGADGRWDSGEIPTGGTFTLVAGAADGIGYFCRYHPTMTATLTVP